MTYQPGLITLADFEAPRNQQQNLAETNGRLVALVKNFPEGESREELLEKISCLDVIAEVMKRAVEGFKWRKGQIK
jgi:hypothetical protein